MCMKIYRSKGPSGVSLGFALTKPDFWMWRQPPRPPVAAAAAESQSGPQRGAAYDTWLTFGGSLRFSFFWGRGAFQNHHTKNAFSVFEVISFLGWQGKPKKTPSFCGSPFSHTAMV